MNQHAFHFIYLSLLLLLSGFAFQQYQKNQHWEQQWAQMQPFLGELDTFMEQTIEKTRKDFEESYRNHPGEVTFNKPIGKKIDSFFVKLQRAHQRKIPFDSTIHITTFTKNILGLPHRKPAPYQREIDQFNKIPIFSNQPDVFNKTKTMLYATASLQSKMIQANLWGIILDKCTGIVIDCFGGPIICAVPKRLGCTKVGEPIDIEIVCGEISTFPYTLMVNGKPVKVRSGIGSFSEIADKVGKKKLFITAKFQSNYTKEVMTKKSDFTYEVIE